MNRITRYFSLKIAFSLSLISLLISLLMVNSFSQPSSHHHVKENYYTFSLDLDTFKRNILLVINNARLDPEGFANKHLSYFPDVQKDVASRPSVPSLQFFEKLGETAQLHSEEMAMFDFLSHHSKDGRTFSRRVRSHYDYQAVAENIAAGFFPPDEKGSALDMVKGWIIDKGWNPPGHRNVIFSKDYTHIGIGWAFNEKSFYKFYITTDFGKL